VFAPCGCCNIARSRTVAFPTCIPPHIWSSQCSDGDIRGLSFLHVRVRFHRQPRDTLSLNQTSASAPGAVDAAVTQTNSQPGTATAIDYGLPLVALVSSIDSSVAPSHGAKVTASSTLNTSSALTSGVVQQASDEGTSAALADEDVSEAPLDASLNPNAMQAYLQRQQLDRRQKHKQIEARRRNRLRDHFAELDALCRETSEATTQVDVLVFGPDGTGRGKALPSFTATGLTSGAKRKTVERETQKDEILRGAIDLIRHMRRSLADKEDLIRRQDVRINDLLARIAPHPASHQSALPIPQQTQSQSQQQQLFQLPQSLHSPSQPSAQPQPQPKQPQPPPLSQLSPHSQPAAPMLPAASTTSAPVQTAQFYPRAMVSNAEHGPDMLAIPSLAAHPPAPPMQPHQHHPQMVSMEAAAHRGDVSSMPPFMQMHGPGWAAAGPSVMMPPSAPYAHGSIMYHHHPQPPMPMGPPPVSMNESMNAPLQSTAPSPGVMSFGPSYGYPPQWLGNSGLMGMPHSPASSSLMSVPYTMHMPPTGPYPPPPMAMQNGMMMMKPPPPVTGASGAQASVSAAVKAEPRAGGPRPGVHPFGYSHAGMQQ